MKSETINLLASNSIVELPEINISVTPEPAQGNQTYTVEFEIINDGPMQTDYDLDYVLYNHIGWDYGTASTAYLSEGNPTFTTDFNVTSNVDVITLAAGIDATYGGFTKRITASEVYLLGDTAHTDPPAGLVPGGIETHGIMVYPNPASDRILIKTDYAGESFCRITDISGRILLECTILEQDELDIHTLPKGCYLVSVRRNSGDNMITPIIKME